MGLPRARLVLSSHVAFTSHVFVLQRHKGKYRIYNLCVEKAYQYDHAKFGNSVQCARSALSAKQPFGLMPRYLRPPGISNRTYICFKAARWRLLWLTGSGLLCFCFAELCRAAAAMRFGARRRSRAFLSTITTRRRSK